MNDTVTAALIGGAAALLTGLYTVGGRSALQRRVIKQELDMLNVLDSGDARRHLARLIDARLVSYVVQQRLPVPPAVLEKWFRLAVICMGLMVTTLGAFIGVGFILNAAGSSTDSGFLAALRFTASAALLVTVLIYGGVVGVHTGNFVRIRLARRRWATYAQDRERLGDLIAEEQRF